MSLMSSSVGNWYSSHPTVVDSAHVKGASCYLGWSLAYCAWGTSWSDEAAGCLYASSDEWSAHLPFYSRGMEPCSYYDDASLNRSKCLLFDERAKVILSHCIVLYCCLIDGVCWAISGLKLGKLSYCYLAIVADCHYFRAIKTTVARRHL